LQIFHHVGPGGAIPRNQGEKQGHSGKLLQEKRMFGRYASAPASLTENDQLPRYLPLWRWTA
jgi:hypothetical protein